MTLPGEAARGAGTGAPPRGAEAGLLPAELALAAPSLVALEKEEGWPEERGLLGLREGQGPDAGWPRHGPSLARWGTLQFRLVWVRELSLPRPAGCSQGPAAVTSGSLPLAEAPAPRLAVSSLEGMRP